ncbi:polyprotein [Rhynchospora pubera]|uniref:Polyprotein n=1 Tax=Rhynchospora pubera TaxID=906938 RepID=A0AAV8DDA2_9POAL|nr:polyprotein [Rhynchospora pubera]
MELLLPEPVTSKEHEEFRISLHATGEVNGVSVIALVDSGSTHSFVNPKIVKQSGYSPTLTKPMEITVANRGKMYYEQKCDDMLWVMCGQEFQFDLKVMEIGSYDLLLGGDWIKKEGPILLDVGAPSITLIKGEMKIVLKGIQELPKRSTEKNKRQVQQDETCMLIQAFPIGTNDKEIIVPDSMDQLLNQYSEIFKEPKKLPPKRAHDHAIPLKTGTEPINLRPYRHSHEQKAAIEKLVDEMLAASVMRPSSSPFASLAILVKKKDGIWIMCIDYRRLNNLTIKNKYPIPVIDELLEELKGAVVFSKIDLRAGYHQIRVKEEDISKTAFRVHHGHFEFRVMPFGLTNAPASFQNLMNDVFKEELRKSVLVFFDDILVYSKSWEEHLQHLEIVFQKLRAHRLFAKMSKCAFGVERVDYLGYIISKDGVATDASKIEAIIHWPTPQNARGLRGFLGLAGYYRRFVKDYGVICKPLTQLLGKKGFQWSLKAQEAFERLKTAMTSAPVLALPDFFEPFCIEADACDVGLGAVLTQNGRPLVFLSKALGVKNAAKSTYEKELMAIVMAISKWRHYLQDKPFVTKTDQQSLKYLLEQKLKHQLQHKALVKFIGPDYTIRYKRGKHNVVADALSRRDCNTQHDRLANGVPHVSVSHLSSIIPVLGGRSQEKLHW